jgi:hypothetical protein
MQVPALQDLVIPMTILLFLVAFASAFPGKGGGRHRAPSRPARPPLIPPPTFET